MALAQTLVDAFLPLLLAYHIGFWTWKGTTVGGIICQLRVTRVDGTPLRFVDALVRGLSSIFSLAVVGLGCLWILKDPERQAWPDKLRAPTSSKFRGIGRSEGVNLRLPRT